MIKLLGRYIIKWFKHQSCARNDEKLSRLEDKSGLEGYGFYFKMLEIVAEVIDSTDKHEVTYSLSRWGRQTNITSKKWLFLSLCCSDVGLMFVCRASDDITVRIPNLLKYRDNHTKNLQATYKQEVEVEVEQIQKKKEHINTKHISTEDKNKYVPPIGAELLQDWLKVRKKKRAGDVTERVFKGLQREAKEAGITDEQAVTVCCERTWQTFTAEWYLKKPNPAWQNVQEARLDVARQIWGNKNGNDRQIIDIGSGSADQGYGARIPETFIGFREPDEFEVAGD